MRSRRAWVYVLSVAALLAPVCGIVYLGAVSYRDERGAVDAQVERQYAAARDVAHRIEVAIDAAFEQIDRATTGTPVSSSLATYWFWIDRDHQLRVPSPAPVVVGDSGGSIDRGAPCSAGRIEDCVRELSTRPTRLARLRDAQRAEACRGDGCAASWAEARRTYSQLAAYADTGPTALLGLARVLIRTGDPHAQATLAEIDHRFADRNYEGVGVPLVTALLRAETQGPDATLDLADGVLAGRYRIDPIIRLGVLASLRHRVDPPAGRELTPPQTRRRADLDARIASIRADARAAAGLADDLPELERTATVAWRGRTASHEPGRTLVYRKRADGAVIGMAVDAAMLERAAGTVGDAVALHVAPLVLPQGVRPSRAYRELAETPLAQALPQLSLWLVNTVGDPDPRDEILRERSRRHVAYTSVLAIVLGLGMFVTIRGAARARELARLKSDFVSTVSHELKTPLTSIRMFAEMLEQGVAKGDPTKMARYHGVIVAESQRLGLLIANLLDYAQIERGTRRYAIDRHEAGKLARDAVTTFETLRDPDRGSRNPLEIEVSSEAMLAEIQVDRDVVIQAMLNLLANAAKYGGADKPITIAVTADSDATAIAVTDQGPGIPPSEQARIFREFYRAPEAYSSGVEGTGLGLALVKRHIEAMGGHVDVASTLGHGATFTIRFPRAGRVQS
ncbi:MAG TPA: HAMP domain-containing sensor histidine kinase [Kofleriaceae bacterium]|nr:HAMP domain-containing sensor histidine kinase [Kofleriaceae bacterium]